MNVVTICPCCSDTMLHHFSQGKEYWFCRNCWQEMPDLKSFKSNKPQPDEVISWSIGFSKSEPSLT